MSTHWIAVFDEISIYLLEMSHKELSNLTKLKDIGGQKGLKKTYFVRNSTGDLEYDQR